MEYCYRSVVKNTIKFLYVMSLWEILHNKVTEFPQSKLFKKKSALVNTCERSDTID